jgi:tRNA 5-methylaminomethyl-2-thiouridine biosynthesis bifunctional protein
MTGSPSFDAIIIGGGIAGAGTARALAHRGLSVLICEALPHLAGKASGNARGLLMPYVATHSSPPGRLYAHGFRFTYQLLTETLSHHNLFQRCGALQLPATKRLARLITESSEFVGDSPIHRLSAVEATERAGISVSTPSFFIPEAGFCNPAEITHTLITTAPPLITVWCSRRVTSLTPDGGGWRITCADGSSARGVYTVLCGAHEITSLPQTSWVPLEPIRGQTAQTSASQGSLSLRTVISYDGYITPSYEGTHFVGAHYRHNDMNETPTREDTTEILSRLCRTLPTISNLEVTSSRVCFRASTHDRMPYIGELPSHDGAGLFINAGHGSRGLVTAPLGGEIVARLMLNESLGDCEQAACITSATRLSKRFQAASTTHKATQR